ncbi:MAG: hypothetical protein JEY71_00265 [Sphaerochaeta sp.]|nr:hypothetical protein [Sphaerochaeta sp.]
MQRKHILAYLLFSLFLFFLLSSCFLSSSGDGSRLASEAKYGELERKTALMLSKRIEAEPLYYRGVALQQLDRKEDAYHVLKLYFAIAKGDDDHLVEAHRLMCLLSLDANTPLSGISSGRWLEERMVLEERETRAYYQALLMIGDSREAARIFELYLKDTIEPYAYAQMVLGTLPDREKLQKAFVPLSPLQQLTLLQSVASDTLDQERATLLLSLAIPLEQAFEGRAELVQVYSLLQALYGYADVRVQQRKYSTLAQNFL